MPLLQRQSLLWLVCLNTIVKLCLVVIVAMFFFIFIVLGLVSKYCGVSIFALIKLLKNELLLAFSTASSESVLPIVMKKMEHFGVPRDMHPLLFQQDILST